MRIPRPITDAEYERELNRAVQHFEVTVTEMRRKLAPESALGRVYQAFLDSPEPLTMLEAHEKAGIFDKRQAMRGGRIGNLLTCGWIIRDGSKIKSWPTKRGSITRAVATFRVAPIHPQRKIKADAIIVREFLRQVDALEQRRMATACLAPQITKGMEGHIPSPRGRLNAEEVAEIVQRRLRGEELDSIAGDFGVTRERVRQIFEEAFRRGRESGHN